MVGENHQKQKKHKILFGVCISKPKTNKKQGKQKKQSFEAKPSSLFKVCFFVLRSCGYCHSLHITSFQIYQDNKQGLYMFILSICVCVLYVYIYICVS